LIGRVKEGGWRLERSVDCPTSLWLAFGRHGAARGRRNSFCPRIMGTPYHNAAKDNTECHISETVPGAVPRGGRCTGCPSSEGRWCCDARYTKAITHCHRKNRLHVRRSAIQDPHECSQYGLSLASPPLIWAIACHAHGMSSMGTRGASPTSASNQVHVYRIASIVWKSTHNLLDNAIRKQ
jgi:hypothetical protein